MKKCAFVLTALIALSSLALAGCGKSSVSFNISDEHTALSSEDKTLTLDLIGIPSTGYQWTCETADEDILKETSHETNDSASSGTDSEPLVGTSVTEHYTFEAVSDGETTITAKYARSWEENADDLCYVYNVTIEDGKITDVSLEGEPTIDEIIGEAMQGTDSVLKETEALESTLTKTTAAGTDA